MLHRLRTFTFLVCLVLVSSGIVSCGIVNPTRPKATQAPKSNPPVLTPTPAESTPTPGWETASFSVHLEPIATGIKLPVLILSPLDGTHRLFVLQRKGTIRVLQAGKLLSKPFLDLKGLVSADVGQALQSMAFAPDFRSSGLFYLSYNRKPDGALVLARYHVAANSNVADPNSATEILVIPQPEKGHSGGQLAFGPDGYLYFSVGDGGPTTDGKFAQPLNTLLGKLLRIDVSTLPYRIPPDNPFVNRADARPEIWAYGLRNPWRFAFDSANGDLYLVDVGDMAYEEVNFQPASSPGGANYGWHIMEGKHCHTPAHECQTDALTLPIFEYPHAYGCAIVGGIVYRGERIAPLNGSYLFGDFCFGRLWSISHTANGEWRASEVANLDKRISAIAEDEEGNLYVAEFRTATLYRVIVE